MNRSFCAALTAALFLCGATSPKARTSPPQVAHVLLISVDGMHAIDLARYIRTRPHSTLAKLSGSGVTYANAYTPTPADSFPGTVALVTGGTPKTTGVYYDDSYDRTLSPPGSHCRTRGTEVVYTEDTDRDSKRLDGGGIDPNKLPLDPARGCTPVWPHRYLRVNTVFEVVKATGGRTAWSDKHPAYEFLNGPSGRGVDDSFDPEIDNASHPTDSVAGCERYDALKVRAILNEIDGFDHTGKQRVGVPAVFGLNFQAVSVAQKTAGNGYRDAGATPGAGLQNALDFVDGSLGKFVAELEKRGLRKSTLIIVVAKHGQAPIDPASRKIVSSKAIPKLIDGIKPGLLAQATQDDGALIWLRDSREAAAVTRSLEASHSLGIAKVYNGTVNPPPGFALSPRDPRAPDVIVRPVPGAIYTKLTSKKIAEHGGYSDDDTHVALLVSKPGMERATVSQRVGTVQVAPTILGALRINPNALEAVRLERTKPLPTLLNLR